MDTRNVVGKEIGNQSSGKAPIILGMILGPMAEYSVRRDLLISRGDATELLTRSLSIVLAMCTVTVSLLPVLCLLIR
ncbi:MAG: hypothetical protein AB8B64_22355 [Granulosicoccus sp.]